MLDGFDDQKIALPSGLSLRVRQAGAGQPILLLHGYPQTHLCWHKVAPDLVAAGYRVILPDLRGYGGSDKPASDNSHGPYSKRSMALDLAQLMSLLGHERFLVAGHDRGARVALRLARDHGDRVAAVSFLDIVPTDHIYGTADTALATAYYHWFFLIQPNPYPETLISQNPDFYLDNKLTSLSRGLPSCFDPEVVAEYKRCFRDPDCIHATCEDYRAGASIDLTHDAEDRDRPLAMPVQVLWGGNGIVGKRYDVPDVWRSYAQNLEAYALDCGHFLPEEAPEATTQALLDFFAGKAC